jgi:phage antirepressor YoqD-like protein
LLKRKQIKTKVLFFCNKQLKGMGSQIFNYNGNSITFQLGNGDVMVNATEMAKPFGKRTADFLQNQQTKNYIREYSVTRKTVTGDLVNVIQGGNSQGTWMHEDLALEFSRWLSPSFSIWCNDRIKELLRHGMTATSQTVEQMLDNPDVLIQTLQKLKEERAEKDRLKLQNEQQREVLQLSAPKVEYYNEVLTSTSTYTTTLIAKELGYSATALNRMLHDLKVQYKQNDTWVLYFKYQNLGYTKTTTSTYTDSTGQTRTSMLTVWTEKGRKFIHDMLKLEKSA